MPRGRTTSLMIRLTPAERLTRMMWQRSVTSSAGLARRARILLLRADRMTITDMAMIVGLRRRHTYKWIQRFVQEGLEGLEGKPGRGRRHRPLLPELREEPNNLDVG
jgi:CRP-like cAMP-binding protein